MKKFSNSENLKKIAWVFLIVGGINRGLVGLFNFDLVAWLFGYMSFLARVVYVIVGLSTAYLLLDYSAKIKK